MKKLFVSIILTLLITGTSFAQRDNFNRTDASNIVGSEKWVAISNIPYSGTIGIYSNQVRAYYITSDTAYCAWDSTFKFADKNSVIFTMGNISSTSTARTFYRFNTNTNKNWLTDTLHWLWTIRYKTNDSSVVELYKRGSGNTTQQYYRKFYAAITANDSIKISLQQDTSWFQYKKTTDTSWRYAVQWDNYSIPSVLAISGIRGAATDWNFWLGGVPGTMPSFIDNYIVNTTGGAPPAAGDTIDPTMTNLKVWPYNGADTANYFYITGDAADNTSILKIVTLINGIREDSIVFATNQPSYSYSSLSKKYSTSGYRTYQFIVTDTAGNSYTTPLDSFLVNYTSPLWRTFYVLSWETYMGVHVSGYGDGTVPITSFDWSAATHWIMFTSGPLADGSLGWGNLHEYRRKPFNDIAHANGKPVLLALGGAGNLNWNAACSDTVIDDFLFNVLNVFDTCDYDGIDLDIEPFTTITGSPNDTLSCGKFIRRLYDSLQVRYQTVNPTARPLLTTAILPTWAGIWWKQHEWMFDQINIMTYDMAQSMGWGTDRTWHNNALTCPLPPTGTNAYYTSINTRWDYQMGYGSTPSKYGIGIDCNGYLYRGGIDSLNPTDGLHSPKRLWKKQYPPNRTGDYNFDDMYAAYIDTATSATKRRDTLARAAYIEIDNPGYANDALVSYTDEIQVKNIIDTIKSLGGGGFIFWNYGEHYLYPSEPNRNLFVDWIKAAAGTVTPPPDTIPLPPAPGYLLTPVEGSTNQDTALEFTWSSVSGATKYRIQITSTISDELFPDFTVLFMDDSSAVTSSINLDGFSKTTTYYWRVATKNVTGWSTFSNYTYFTTVYATPSIPVLVYPTANLTGLSAPFAYRWNISTSATSYQFQLITDTSGSNYIVNQASITDTIFTPSASYGLGVIYYWRVRGINSQANSAYSSWRKFTYKTTTPLPSVSTMRQKVETNQIIKGRYRDGISFWTEGIRWCNPWDAAEPIDSTYVNSFIDKTDGVMSYKIVGGYIFKYDGTPK